MDLSLQLAMALGRLEGRVRALEITLERQSLQRPAQPEPCTAEEGDGAQADRLLQQGIDNIMSYQWPPKKEEEERE